MKLVVLLGILLATTPAFADLERAERLTRTARTSAQRGECGGIARLARNVRSLDDLYYREMFAADPAIARCIARVSVGARSPYVALSLSLATTVAGVIALGRADAVFDESLQATLVIGGLVAIAAGPTLGNAYAGNTWNTGLQIRLASMGVALLGVGIVATSCPPFGRCESPGAGKAGVFLIGASALAYIVGTGLEIINAPLAATRHNERRWTLAPAITNTGAGVGVGTRF